MCGITGATSDPEGGKIEREAGEPTGILRESALGDLLEPLKTEDSFEQQTLGAILFFFLEGLGAGGQNWGGGNWNKVSSDTSRCSPGVLQRWGWLVTPGQMASYRSSYPLTCMAPLILARTVKLGGRRDREDCANQQATLMAPTAEEGNPAERTAGLCGAAWRRGSDVSGRCSSDCGL